MDDLVRDGRVIRGWIGVEPRDLPADLAASLGLEKVQGVLITGVLQGGPAAQAGVRPGDVVTAVGDRPVQTTADLLKAVAALKPQTNASTSRLVRGRRPAVRATRADFRPSSRLGVVVRVVRRLGVLDEHLGRDDADLVQDAHRHGQRQL